jgi:predicted RNase H-like HicB family nuclease
MTIPVMVQPAQGQFDAFLVGAPEVTATASTREEALAKLETAISRRVEQGELVMLEIPLRGFASVFGAFRDDPTLQEICDEAYRQRDADIQK